jgi:hypothetical protein
LPAANIVGTVANATYATSAGAANSVAGANVVGAVTFATTANAVAGANVSGTVANATYAVTAGTANSVAIANVVGAGNIAVLNLNGDGAKVLAGNGAWVTSSGGTTTQDLSLVLTGTAIDVTLASYFYYTATTNVTLSVTNVPTTANVVTSFILEITNGSTRITWWPEIKWAGGVVPTLTTTGTDVIAFYSYNDAGTIKWRGLPLAFDIK